MIDTDVRTRSTSLSDSHQFGRRKLAMSLLGGAGESRTIPVGKTRQNENTQLHPSLTKSHPALVHYNGIARSYWKQQLFQMLLKRASSLRSLNIQTTHPKSL